VTTVALLNSLPAILAETDATPAARGVLVALMVLGTALLLFGARLLRPAVVLAAMFVGFLGAIVTARALLPGTPLWIAAAVGAVAGLIAGALIYRPTIGIMAAIVGSAVGALVAFAIMAGGSLDTAPRDLGHALVVSPRETARPGEGERAGIHLLAILNGHDGTDGTLSDAADAALPAGDRLLRSAVDVTHRAAARVGSAYRETAPAYRTLLAASVGAGALAGFLAGILATTLVAQVLTSFAGGWMLLVGLLPLLALHGLDPMPPDARVWLVTLASLAVVGTIAQSALGAGAKPAPKARRSEKSAPRASAGAIAAAE
jgi:hypothetical protein